MPRTLTTTDIEAAFSLDERLGVVRTGLIERPPPCETVVAESSDLGIGFEL